MTGEMSNSIDKVKNEGLTKGLTKGDVLKTATRFGLAGTIAAFMAGCVPDSSVSQNNSSTPTETVTNPTSSPETIFTSGKYNVVTDKERHDEIANSLPVDKPKAKYGDSSINVFSISTGSTEFNFAMYDIAPDDAQKQPGIKLTDKDGNVIVVEQTKALYSEFIGYDGKKSWERLVLVAIPQVDESGKLTGETGVTWVYNEQGFPNGDDEKPIDLNRPVLGYFVPFTADSTMSFWPLVTEPGLLVRIDAENPIAVTPESPPPPSFKTVASFLPKGNIGSPISAISTASPESVLGTPLELGGNVKIQFTRWWTADSYINLAGHERKTIPSISGSTFLIVEGLFTGDMSTVINDSGDYVLDMKTLYVEGRDWEAYKSFVPAWTVKTEGKNTLQIGFLVRYDDPGPFILHSGIYDWQVDVNSLQHVEP